MATRTRPFVLTGAALASAAAVVMATPDLISSRDLSVASAPSPTRLSSASYDLAAFSDINVQDLNDAYWFGWGGYVGCGDVNAQGECTYTPQDPYYPGVNEVFASGYSGILYYLVDNVIDQFSDDFNLDNYYFEIGWLNSGNPNSSYSGLGSVIYVGLSELFGADSAVGQAAKTIFYYGVTNFINSTIVALTSAIVPEIELGPLTVGGGILASLYYYGLTPDESFKYPGYGLPAVWAYISTSLTELVPTAAATPESSAATTLAAVAEKATDTAEVAKSGVGEVKSEAGSVAPAADPNVESAKIAPTAETSPTDTTTTDTAVTPTDTTVSGEAAVAAAAGETTSAASGSADTGSTDTASATASSGTSTDADTAASSSEGASVPTSVSTGGSAAGKTTKPKSQSPVGKITGKIRSALGGESTGGKHRADRSGSSSSASSSSDSGSSSSDSDK